MLKELYIENLAVISKANIRFEKNLNIFSGETGAGKSIVINGINAILGQRKSKDIVRTGTDKAIISALFVNLSDSTKSILRHLGYNSDEDELLISREIMADGGSVARVNSRPATVNVLKQIGETLINIHGQHDSQILLSPERHIDIIDRFADTSILLADYKKLFKELQDTAREIKRASENEGEKAFRLSKLEEIIEDISSLDTYIGEDEEIENEFLIYKNAAYLTETISKAYNLLRGSDDSDGIATVAENLFDEIYTASEFMSELEPLSARLKTAAIELDDIGSELNYLKGNIEVDPGKYNLICQRRDELIKIKKKYGAELQDVLDLYDKSVLEYNSLSDSENSLVKLNERKNLLLSIVSKKAKELSEIREKACKVFIKNVSEELKFLNMPNVTFQISQRKGKLTLSGMDEMEFLISANLGEAPKPISKIASGGELSRIMLALKSVIADKDDIDTLIFDEIDTGVSGRAAQKIGIKLADIAKHRQVICVTHLAQIAVMSDNHLLIEKNTIKERTETTVNSIDFNGKVKEIARIMGGDSLTDLMLKSAEQMIKDAKA